MERITWKEVTAKGSIDWYLYRKFSEQSIALDYSKVPAAYDVRCLDSERQKILNIITDERVLAEYERPYSRQNVAIFSDVAYKYKMIKDLVENSYHKQGSDVVRTNVELADYERFKVIGEAMKQKNDKYQKDEHNKTEKCREIPNGIAIAWVVVGIIIFLIYVNNGGRNAEGSDAVLNNIMMFSYLAWMIGYFFYRKFKYQKLGEALEKAEDEVDSIRQELNKNHLNDENEETTVELEKSLKDAETKVGLIRGKINHEGPLERF